MTSLCTTYVSQRIGSCLPDSHVLFISQLQSKMPDFQQTLFPPQQWHSNPRLAPFHWLLSCSTRLPGKVEGHSCQSYFNQILHGSVWFINISWGWGHLPLSDKVIKSLLFLLCCSRTAFGPGWGVLSSSLDSENRFQMTQENCFTILGFYVNTGLASNKDIEGHFLLLF